MIQKNKRLVFSGPRAVLSRTVHPPPAVGVKLRVRSQIFGFSTAWLRRVEFEFAVHIPRRGVPWTPPGTCRVSSAAHHTFPANAPSRHRDGNPHFAKSRKIAIGAKWGGRRAAAGASARAELWAAGGQPQCFWRVVSAFWVAEIIGIASQIR